ncbi:MAG: 7-carboxy-7-deazaguanine synthase QueE [Chthonomonas sp.]|nr:7-carboxy-7-deazaguanine synthase QueE [Chthonomonas sp.]
MKLRIAEIFESIQGEGFWTGRPSIFIRISGCNLRCVWCDTPYASWEPEGPIREVEDILEEVTNSPIKDVVVTGGEPMLFDGVVPLCEGLKRAGKTITIETAGTIRRDLPCDLMSISPKLRHSTPMGTDWEDRHEELRLNLPVINELTKAYNHQLKFVVNPEHPETGIDEINQLLTDLDADPSKVILMPEGTDSETLHRRARLLAPICMERAFALGQRLHIDLYGNTKGT